MKNRDKSDKKFVVLEHLQGACKGSRFWTTNSENNTFSTEGEEWYKEIEFTDSKERAIELCRTRI